jgi:flagellar hook-basal body complex protein FliE
MATATSPKKSTTRARPRPAKKDDGVPAAIKERLDQVNSSLDAAEAAAKHLRTGVEKGSRDMVHDLERAVRHARANAERVGKSVAKDFTGSPKKR